MPLANIIIHKTKAGLPTLDEGLEWEMRGGRPLPAYKVAQVPKKLMSGGGGGTPTPFFPDLKIFASILQAHCTLCTSQTSDKQTFFFFFFCREILFFQRENGVKCIEMREIWQLWQKKTLVTFFTLSNYSSNVRSHLQKKFHRDLKQFVILLLNNTLQKK